MSEKQYAIIHEADGDTIWRWQTGRKAPLRRVRRLPQGQGAGRRRGVDPRALGLPVRPARRARRRQRGRHPGRRRVRHRAAGRARLSPPRPGPGELEAARERTVPDVVADDLRLLLVGISPGLWTAWSGHALRPALAAASGPPATRPASTPRLRDPSERESCRPCGIGSASLVPRTTRGRGRAAPRASCARRGERLAALVARHRSRRR